MEIRDAIYQRRAVRQYTSQPVDRETLRHLIDAAVQAPSAVNQQPWLFAVVQERALLDRISEEAKAYMLKQSPAGLVSHHLRDTLGDPGFHIFYHAPALVLICTRTPTPWAVEDCALAAENLMLAACAAGLGTCWIGFAQNWLGTPEGKSAVGLPAGCVPVAPIIVGHPKAPAPPVPRKEPEIRWIG